MHAPDGSFRKPAGARAPDGAGRAATGRAHQGPRREWRRRGRRRTPTLAAALARPRALGRRHGGARRSRDAAGRRAGRADTPPPPVACLVTSGRWDARPPARARAMATARPIHRRRPPRGRRRAEWVGNGTTGRGRKPRRDERWTRGQGSARFCCPMAARATAEIGRAACLMPPTGLSLRKSLFFCESAALVARATIRKRSAFAQARNGSLGVGLLPFLGGVSLPRRFRSST